MQTRQWHLFLVLVVGLPLKLHSSQGLFFPKTAILMLRERFLIAENTCGKKWAVPLLLCRCRPCQYRRFPYGETHAPTHLSMFCLAASMSLALSLEIFHCRCSAGDRTESSTLEGSPRISYCNLWEEIERSSYKIEFGILFIAGLGFRYMYTNVSLEDLNGDTEGQNELVSKAAPF